MKVAVILGTRPEAIRLYHTINTVQPDWVFWTGQNYSKNLAEDILEDPRFGNTYKNIVKHNTNKACTFEAQFSSILIACTDFLEETNPDKVLILGDTNSSLAAALAAKKLGISLYHMEAGNRCYNPKSPEEVNRRMIDSIADVHLCYTTFAKRNLLSEGAPQNRIHVIGNPMAEFPEMHHERGYSSAPYTLIDIHRAENEKYLDNISTMLDNIKTPYKLLLHPRFVDRFDNALPSVNFSEFVKLEKGASLIITDSGTVCEEAYLLRKPCIVLRETMERPELLEAGNTVLVSPKNAMNVLDIYNSMLDYSWIGETFIEEYKYNRVSIKVKRILQGTGNFI